MLLDSVHDVEMMMRKLDMMSLDYLNYLLGGIHGVKEMMMRLDHLNNVHNQIFRLPLHVSEGEDEGVIEFHVH